MRNSKMDWMYARHYRWDRGLLVHWQGWLLLGVWVAVLFFAAPWLALKSTPLFIVFMAFMGIVLVVACYVSWLDSTSPRFRERRWRRRKQD